MTSGVGMLRTFVHVNLRLLTPAFVNGWLWVLVHSAKDFSVALLLATASSNLLANKIFGAFTGGGLHPGVGPHGLPHRVQPDARDRRQTLDNAADQGLLGVAGRSTTRAGRRKR